MNLGNPERLRFAGTARARHIPGVMNKTESRYAERLDLLKAAGEILRYRFEPIAFRLADRTTYTPDFEVVLLDGTLVYDEVKGFRREDAMVKIKVAARLFGDRVFRLCEFRRGVWTITVMPPHK